MPPTLESEPKKLLYCTWDPSRAKDLEIVFDVLRGGPALMAFLQASSHLSVGSTSRLDLRDSEVRRKAAAQLGASAGSRALPAAVVANALCITLQPPTHPDPICPSSRDPGSKNYATVALLRSHGYLDLENRPTLRCVEDEFCDGDVIDKLFGDQPKLQCLTDHILTSFPGTGSVEVTAESELYLYINALDCQKLRREVWRCIVDPPRGCDYTLADSPHAGAYCFSFTSQRHGPMSNYLADIFCLHVHEPQPPSYDAREEFLRKSKEFNGA